MRVWIYIHLFAWWAIPLASKLPVRYEKVGNSTYQVRAVGSQVWAYGIIHAVTPWELEDCTR